MVVASKTKLITTKKNEEREAQDFFLDLINVQCYFLFTNFVYSVSIPFSKYFFIYIMKELNLGYCGGTSGEIAQVT